MGGQQSSRRISIDNEEPSNVIKVSEKVVERLKGSVEAESKPIPHNAARSPNSTVHIQPKKTAAPAPPPPAAEPPFQFGVNERMREQYEDEIQKNDEYWKNRIESLQKTHEKVKETYNAQYDKALADVDKYFPRMPPENPQLPCQDHKSTVISCYKENKEHPLRCAKEVQEFSNCMNSTRIQLQADDKLS